MHSKSEWNRETENLLTKISNVRLNVMLKPCKYRIANILNCHIIFYKFECSGKTCSDAFNFRILVDCLNQKNLKKLKETISLV